MKKDYQNDANVQAFVSELKAKRNPEALAETAGRMTNSFSYSADGVADYLTSPEGEPEEAAKVSFAWVKALTWLGKNRHFDGRNKASVEIAENLAADGRFAEEAETEVSVTDADLDAVSRTLSPKKLADVSYEAKFAAKMAREHRTLQQTWSTTAFRILRKTSKAVREMETDGTLCEGWFRTPFV